MTNLNKKHASMRLFSEDEGMEIWEIILGKAFIRCLRKTVLLCTGGLKKCDAVFRSKKVCEYIYSISMVRINMKGLFTLAVHTFHENSPIKKGIFSSGFLNLNLTV